jgi:hypothetical protein
VAHPRAFPQRLGVVGARGDVAACKFHMRPSKLRVPRTNRFDFVTSVV